MRHQPMALQSTINAEVQKMLHQGVIQPSFSPWLSPVVMVKKKDGSWRFCIDYCKLNGATYRDAYKLQMPLTQRLVEFLVRYRMAMNESLLIGADNCTRQSVTTPPLSVRHLQSWAQLRNFTHTCMDFLSN